MVALSGDVTKKGKTAVKPEDAGALKPLLTNFLSWEPLVPKDAKQLAVSDVSRWMAAGKIMHNLGPKFSLDEIVQAHEAVEGGAIGKVYIEF